MAHDLHHLIRATFNTDILDSHDLAAAFDRAVEILVRRRPLLGEAAARQEVATVLGIDPERLSDGLGETAGRSASSNETATEAGDTPMTRNLHGAVRGAYREALAERRSETEAFNRAVDLLLERDSLVGRIEARRSVARMLAQEPATLSSAASERR
jgi:hypothetical protein